MHSECPQLKKRSLDIGENSTVGVPTTLNPTALTAPIVYANIVAVKKLVVEFLRESILCFNIRLRTAHYNSYCIIEITL